jgi:6-pyruvoyltetrahydropterin/6-carboxytetrahydropterin synthase
MFQIDKTFEFCYGHRVWTQKLDGRFSDDLKCACRHLHGHEAKVQVFLNGEILNEQGMVTDFRHLEWLKKWLNEFLDHKFVIDVNDPLLPMLIPTSFDRLPVQVNDLIAGWTVFAVAEDVPEHQREMLAGFLMVDFVPTSENFAKWLHCIVQHKMEPLGVHVSRIDWWETPKSRSSFLA